MATHNGGWLIGVVEGATEEGAPNASVIRLRTQRGTGANSAPRLVAIPLTIWDNTMTRVRTVARPGAMVLVTTTISAERLGRGSGIAASRRFSGPNPAEAMPVDNAGNSSSSQRQRRRLRRGRYTAVEPDQARWADRRP